MSFLPGMFPSAVAAGRRSQLTTLTKVADATSTASTITGPAGIQAGDLLVLWDWAGAAGTPAETVPSGFSILAGASIANFRCILSYKIATGAEASAALTGMAGLAVNKALIVVRGNRAISSVTAGSAAAELTDGSPSSQSVTASGGTPPLVVVGGYATGSGATVSPRTFSTTKDGEVNPNNSLWLAWKIYNSSPADTSIDMDDEGSANGLASGYLACA
jgi:hypothetical protein